MNNNSKQPRPEYKSDKCEVSGRYFVVGGQMAGCRHILTGLDHIHSSCCLIRDRSSFLLFLRRGSVVAVLVKKKKKQNKTKQKKNSEMKQLKTPQSLRENE